MPRSRGRTIVELAGRTARGELALDANSDRDVAEATLLTVPGIGPWTAGYVRMRGFGDPDVFLPDRPRRARRSCRHRRVRRARQPMASVALVRPAPPVGGGMSTLARTTIDTPIGVLTLVASPAGLREVWFPNKGEQSRRNGEPDDPSHPALAAAAVQLGEYFDGTRQRFDLPLDPQGTPFQLAAWRGLTTIPYGETVSYGEQAARIGLAGKARAIGAANGQNPLPIVVPCHRVVGSNGALVGFGGGLETKAWLLHHERQVLGLELPL